MLKQRTLRNSIKAVGIGLHTGKNINMELIPSEANSGINFIRTDVDENLVIPAIAENVGDTSLSTALVKDDVKISTIEHLLSAIAGLGVDNCLIKVDGPEVPIMDGSSSPFVFLIQSAGLEEQDALKKFIKVGHKILKSSTKGEDFCVKNCDWNSRLGQLPSALTPREPTPDDRNFRLFHSALPPRQLEPVFIARDPI